MSLQGFKDFVVEKAEEFRKINLQSKKVKLVGHLDADGITASSLMSHYLDKNNVSYSLSIVQQLNQQFLEEVSKEDFNFFIFVDLGAGQLSFIKKHLNAEILILDHHTLEEEIEVDFTHINPHLFDIDGNANISGAGVVYLFCKALDPEMKSLAHLAIIGAIGDIQENDGFAELNEEILADAVEQGNMIREKGLNLFGSQTRPLHQTLQYASDLKLEGINNSESGAVALLSSIGIDPKSGNQWKKLYELTEEEKQNLTAALIMRSKNPSSVISFTYSLPGQKEGTCFRDAKEFSTMLNSCGRMGKASLGIGVCLDDDESKRKALRTLAGYKKEIVMSLNWFRDNKDSEFITRKDKFMIINAKDKVLNTIVGTMASILVKSGEYPEGFMILSLARRDDGISKASLRISGEGENIDLRDVIREITSLAGGEAGGHKNAAGAMIQTDDEAKFLEIAEQVLSKF